MALDVFVGTFTRYYTRQWENAVQRMAREQGATCTMLHAGGKPSPPPPSDEVRQAVAKWTAELNEVLKQVGAEPLSWDESDSQPYFTDRPDYFGYSALQTWAGHAEHPDLPLPAVVPRSWVDDDAVDRSLDLGPQSRYSAIFAPTLWLPSRFPSVIKACAPTSDEPAAIGSTFALRDQLEALRTATADKLKPWKPKPFVMPPPPPRRGLLAHLFGPKPTRPPPEPEPTLSEAAHHALEMFHGLASKACEHRLPMQLAL